MKKATKGKNGCLKPNGRLKKGFRWAKSRKGFCIKADSAKKGHAKGKKRGPKRHRASQFGPVADPLHIERAGELRRIEAMRAAMSGLRRRRR